MLKSFQIQYFSKEPKQIECYVVNIVRIDARCQKLYVT